YHQYYGYRNPQHNTDPRLAFLNPRWFDGRDVLDIGCNIGHVTLTIARDFNPRAVTGIDIDKKLVNIAMKNVRHYLNKTKEASDFPKSFGVMYGQLPCEQEIKEQTAVSKRDPVLQANYVPETEELLEMVRPQYDVILCLSVTKWVHLNWGDDGLKRFLRRTFLNLRPGGRLVLEPQPWGSYIKRKKLTPTIFENYKSIRFFPDMFEDFLLREVGFVDCHTVATPTHSARGFQRPIQV
ncbi:RNA methyltransferase bin3 C-terminal, partial [Trinorchestia longiramus]